MLSSKIRTAMLALVAAFTFASATPATSEAMPKRMNNGAECVDGTWGKDQFGNVYLCVNGKWVLYSMPAFHAQVRTLG